MEIINLAKELERLRANTHDIVSPTKQITAIEDGGTLKLDMQSYGKWPLTKWGEQQLAEKCEIPVKYFHKMTETPGMAGLAAENVNGWLSKEADTRLVRIADGQVRAILSDRYRPMDNFDLAIQVMDRAKEHGATFQDTELTETRMYLKLVLPNYKEELKPGSGDHVVPGLLVSNSEVGAGAFRVEPFVFRLRCQNGLIGTETLYKVHVGKKLELGIYKEDTLRANDSLLWHETRDLIDATFDRKLLTKQVAQLRGAQDLTVEKPIEEVNATAKDLSLSEERRLDLLRYFTKEGETVFGLVNGITRLAQDYQNYDDRVSIERYAGQRLEQAIPAQ